MSARATRVVVIGASAGGIEALPAVLAALPQDLAAAVLVVQHLRAGSGEHLLPILQRRSELRVQWAEDQRLLENGAVFVAPPDLHLVIDAQRMSLVAGPRENRARPSIDRLFRSAAAHHDARVIGVVLTGLLDDGSAGALAIRRCGGIVLVQDPRDAAFPPMPRNAIETVAPDAILPLAEIGPAVARLVDVPLARAPVPEDVALEVELDARERFDVDSMDKLGAQTCISCPECSGPTWRVGGSQGTSYRCFLGHATSAHTLLSDKDAEVERALWSAVRALEERSRTLAHLARDAARVGTAIAAEYEVRSLEARSDATRARQFLVELRRATVQRARSAAHASSAHGSPADDEP